MKTYTALSAAAAAAFAIASPAAAATQIFATSYSMPNGSGQANGGSFNYWDRSYSGTGSTTTDGAALSGGLGDLTDGVIANNTWNLVENAAGTGPYVGWLSNVTSNPLVTFNFSGSPSIDLIRIYLDNSGIGGVGAPAAILVDGVAQPFTPPVSFGLVELGGLNLSGGSHTVQFNYGAPWTFVSEVQFFSTSAVPEPGTWVLMVAGFALVGFSLRRRPQNPAVSQAAA